MENIIRLTDDDLETVGGGAGGGVGKWAYRIYATKKGYLDIKKISTGYNSSQEAKDAKDWLVRELTSRGYSIHLTAVYLKTE